MVEVTEPSLPQRAIAGDVEAFSQLLQLHDAQMRSVAYRMLGSPTAMDDALQAAYLKAFRAIGTLRTETGFAGWLRRIVVNCCTDQLRQLKHRGEVALDAAGELPSPGSDHDRFVQSQQLNAALMSLSADMRAAVVLVDGEGLSYAEAADALGVEVGTVASRLNRARSALRTKLGLEGEIR